VDVEVSQDESGCCCWEKIGIEALVPTIDRPDRRNIDIEDGDRFDKSGIVDLNAEHSVASSFGATAIRLGIFNQFLHTYYTIISTLDYKFLFEYLQL